MAVPQHRYELSNKEPDASNLDNLKAILHLTESMLLQPQSSPEPKHIIQFFPLSPSHSNDALGIIPNTPLTQPNTSAIFETSLTQHPGSCAINLTTSLVNVTVCFIQNQSLVPDQPLDQVIECLRLAKIHKPKLRRAHFALALYLRARHYMTLVNDDYEEFASTLDEIITSSPPGDSQDEGIVTQAQELVTAVAMFRSSAHKSPEYMEAIYRVDAFRSSFTQAFPAEHLLRFKINKRLENSAKLRFSNFGPTDLEAHEASSSHSPLSQPEPVAFYQPEFVRMYKKVELLEELLSRTRNDVMKIDNAIEKGRSILASFTPTHPLASSLVELLYSARSSMKLSSVQTRSDTLTSRLAPAVKFWGVRHSRPGRRATRHIFDFPCLCSPAAESRLLRVTKYTTSERRWDYSPIYSGKVRIGTENEKLRGNFALETTGKNRVTLEEMVKGDGSTMVHGLHRRVRLLAVLHLFNGQRTKGTNTVSLQNLDLILVVFAFLLVFRQYEDAIYAARYLRYLRDQPQFGFRRHEVTASLVRALAYQVELEARNVMQCIEEMAVLCRELLTLDASNDDTARSLTHLTGVFLSKFSLSATDQPLNQIIECLRLARKHRLDVGVSFALAASLFCRYFTTFANNDYEEAVSALDEIIASTSTGVSHWQDELLLTTRCFAKALAGIRSIAHSTPEYLEEAIYRARTLSDPSSEDDIFAEVTARLRFHFFGSIEGLEASSNEALNAPLSQAALLQFLNDLLSTIRNNDMTEIDETIEKGRIVLAFVPRSLFASTLFHSFGQILSEAFKRTNKIEYLNEAINTYRQAFERTLIPPLRFSSFLPLSNSLLLRIDSGSFPSHRMQDEDEVVKLLSQCINDRHADDISHRVPLDYASYHVDLNQLEEAIETLERGRGLLWSEMRHLRASIDQLLQPDSQLGQRFAAVNRDLEELTMSIPPSHELSIDDGPADDLRAVDPFGRLILKQRGLSKERDNLISQIRSLPGFDSFLTSPSFDTLRSAASSGPVIIINHSEWRSDILILLHNTPPSLIPTPHDFYDRTKTLKDKLLDSRRKHGLDSSLYDESLAFVLAELYELVGEPVIDRLHQLQVPEQSRIWWCPTSVFCSLPLHAMGPIPSDDREKRYFLDLYICSYTPITDRPHPISQSRFRFAISGSTFLTSSARLGYRGDKSHLRSSDTCRLSVEGFHHHQFIHFACHGTLEVNKPFEAGFELYGDKRLTLLDIVTEGSVIDEGLHLAAAVQYCGFRSVVGTMWAMVDEDGRDLAEHFYKALFSNSRREQGVPYHERSAKALRFAVKKLRRKRRIGLERWVNFVHYGA
ncbi:hypothetical protein EDB85DRAFT_1894473 [Lactarius pseudohatsudake]|nr:hypothetical protein EDB85DRAFT_1894473 [Lactarius pseudohatsudake]